MDSMQVRSAAESGDDGGGAASQSETRLRDEVHSLLLDHTDLTADEIDDAAQDKIEKYDGLVSETAALYLVGRDHGIHPSRELSPHRGRPTLDIANVQPDIHNLRITVTVDQVQDVNHVGDDDTPVRNLIVKDDTGRTQLTLWENDVDAAQHIEAGDQLRIDGGYTSESDWCQDRYGCPAELRVGDGQLILVGEDGGEEELLT